MKTTPAQLDREIAAALTKGISEGWYITDDLGGKHVFYGPFASKEATYQAAYYRNAFAPDYESKFLTDSYNPLHGQRHGALSSGRARGRVREGSPDHPTLSLPGEDSSQLARRVGPLEAALSRSDLSDFPRSSLDECLG